MGPPSDDSLLKGGFCSHGPRRVQRESFGAVRQRSRKGESPPSGEAPTIVGAWGYRNICVCCSRVLDIMVVSSIPLPSTLESLPSRPVVFLFLTVLIPSLWLLRSYIRLWHVPGPLLAALTNFPRLSWILTGHAHDIHIALHRKYGKLVRFGPNMVSVADPAEIPNIYGFGGKFVKVNMDKGDTPIFP